MKNKGPRIELDDYFELDALDEISNTSDYEVYDPNNNKKIQETLNQPGSHEVNTTPIEQRITAQLTREKLINYGIPTNSLNLFRFFQSEQSRSICKSSADLQKTPPELLK